MRAASQVPVLGEEERVSPSITTIPHQLILLLLLATVHLQQQLLVAAVAEVASALQMPQKRKPAMTMLLDRTVAV